MSNVLNFSTARAERRPDNGGHDEQTMISFNERVDLFRQTWQRNPTEAESEQLLTAAAKREVPLEWPT